METCIVSSSDFIKAAVGNIYYQAPFNKPRKIDEIVEHITNYFIKNDISAHHFNQVFVDKNNVLEFVRNVLKDCKAFEELNLSQYEYEHGVKVDDEARLPSTFITASLKLKPEYDFVDLDSCYRNIANDLKRMVDEYDNE